MLLLSLITSLLGILLCTQPARSGLYTNPGQLATTEYDFIVVGAGTAGNVIANRLTEESSFTVLVIEAGISSVSMCPILSTTFSPNTSLTWNYTTTAQEGLNGRAIPYPRGRVLGGSSTINFQIWTRASRDDWDRMANVTGDIGWSWDQMLPYIKKTEHLVQPPDHYNTSGEIIPFLHGHIGPVQISLPGFPTEIDQRVLNTTQQFPGEFPFNPDMNSGYPLGIAWAQLSVTTDSRRSSSATAYLEPALNRTNLDVLITTQVTKLVSSKTVDGMPHFDIVEMAQSSTNARFTVSAKREVILCAGAVNTPQLLQLSGIGNETLLRTVGIEMLVELDDVGQHLTDHPFLANHWLVNSTNTSDSIARNTTLATELLQEWEVTGMGRLLDPGTNQIAWLRLPQDDAQMEDASAGPTAAQIELLPVDGFASFVEPIPATGNFLTIVSVVSSPFSRGSVTLSSSDPFDDPVIDPGLLSDETDIEIMVQAIKTGMRMLNATSWRGFVIEPTSSLAAATTTAKLMDYACNFTSTEFHPVGSARMSSASSRSGVLTPSLHVKGTSGLRVVDASVFPFIPAAHLQACVYAVAERAADLIKADWV
ncbi:aryl-alcohol oxidase-like protein [Obba rivulosa]|uniref:Aryl-alcohol oxidase-like protein n=1 Tax=Obba rivulosa TaxID=1052685 RepID=A0A8E2ALT3_9APHY|nr:aryl-alcohol oxidase-like protein [Obba rivulosa]